MRTLPFLVFALILVGIQFLHGMNEFWDDTYIGMLYSKNIARGVGPAFVPLSSVEVPPTARVEGYSNPLWVFLTAGMYLLPGSVFFWLKLTSFLSVLLLAFACRELFRKLVDDPKSYPQWVFLTPMLLILFNASICHYLKSGMETVTFTALVVFATWHTAKLADSPRPGLAFVNALLWLAVILTRPEGILFAFSAGLYLVLALWRPRASLSAAWVLPLLAGTTAFLAWRYSYYGEWLPNTFFAKVAIRGELEEGWIAVFRQGIGYVRKFLFDDVTLTTLAFAAGGVLIWRRHLRPTRLLLLFTMMASNLLFVVLVGGDFWSLSRFLQITGVLLAVLACIPIGMIAAGKPVAGWAVRRQLGIGAGWALPFLLVLGVNQTLVPILKYQAFYGDLPLLSHERLRETLTLRAVQPAFVLGKWLKENLPSDAVIGIDQAGQLAYYSERTAIDVLGLSDHHLARHRLTYEYLRGRGMTHLAAVVIDRNGKSDIIYPQLLDDPEFCRDFRLTHFFSGKDQHAEVESFALFCRIDQLLPGHSDAQELAPGAGLGAVLQRLPAIMLEPVLVHDKAAN
jgi:arabinofuranosyltransferase